MASLSRAQESSGWNFKKLTFEAYGWRCYILIDGLGDGAFMTGTGVNCLFGANIAELVDPYSEWFGHIDKVEVFYGGQSAQIYPIPGDSTPRMDVGRFFRYDSTQGAGSANGTPVPIRLRVDFHFETIEGPVENAHEIREITVTPKAVNVATTAATTQETPSGALPPGWQYVNLPDDYTWQAVSGESAAAAREKLPLANYALSEGTLHLFSALVATQAEVDAAGNPPAVRTLQLSKLLGASTALFTSSHGQTGGFYDDANPMQLVDWASCERTTASLMINQFRNLMCRFNFFYSCQCGANEYAIRSAFHLGTTPISNTACFAFSESVFSTLYAANQKNGQPYNLPDGTLLMTDKLSLHVGDLLTRLASGTTAGQALAETNEAFPPRKYSTSSPNGVNYTDVLFMVNRGDSQARLHTVYRQSTETDANFLQFETWGLLNKSWAALPP